MEVGAGRSGKVLPCNPAWEGRIETAHDALLVVQGCLDGTLSYCFRSPYDRERNHLIVSGNVFVYNEYSSGIKHWRDGIAWITSISRTNFVVYRQLKRRATKKSKRPQKNREPCQSGRSNKEGKENGPSKVMVHGLDSSVTSDHRELGDLLKKIITLNVNDVYYRLVAYESVSDEYKLRTPREDPRLNELQIPNEFRRPEFKFYIDTTGDKSFNQMEGSSMAKSLTPYLRYHHDNNDLNKPMGHSVQATQPHTYPDAYAPAYPPPTAVPYQPFAATAHQSHYPYQPFAATAQQSHYPSLAQPLPDFISSSAYTCEEQGQSIVLRLRQPGEQHLSFAPFIPLKYSLPDRHERSTSPSRSVYVERSGLSAQHFFNLVIQIGHVQGAMWTQGFAVVRYFSDEYRNQCLHEFLIKGYLVSIAPPARG